MSQNKAYAVESYSKSEGYRRHETGTLDEMIKFLEEQVRASLEEESQDLYYRIVEVSEQDLKMWQKQEEMLPQVPKTDRLFGDWVQIGTAAKYLGVTFGRVFNLTSAGEIKANTVGRNKLVNVEDVINRKISNPKSGRPPLNKK